MIQNNQNIFTLAHAEFYETVARRPLSPEYVDCLKRLLPDSWGFQRGDIWIHVFPERELESQPLTTQGFKIHASCTPTCAIRALRLIAPVCVQRGVSFKIAGDPSLLAF